jgi:hypothetical protein
MIVSTSARVRQKDKLHRPIGRSTLPPKMPQSDPLPIGGRSFVTQCCRLWWLTCLPVKGFQIFLVTERTTAMILKVRRMNENTTMPQRCLQETV